MAFEDYRADAMRCNRCSYWKWIPQDCIKSWECAKGCPSVDYRHVHAYSGGGRLIYWSLCCDREMGAHTLDGGGMYISGGIVTIDKIVLSDNLADDNGGGALLTGDIAATLTNCMVTGNKAVTLYGGGLYLAATATAPVLTNCTIAGNYAFNEGGGIYLSGIGITVVNSILWNNADGGIYDDIRGTATV